MCFHFHVVTQIIFAIVLAGWFSTAMPCEREARIDERPLNQAWWLKIHFSPCDTEIYGIPVRSIHPSWRTASLLREEDIPLPKPLAGTGLMFELTNDFNGDGRTDKALVGVYQTETGTGRFFLILSERAPGVWRRAFLRLYPGDPGFLALKILFDATVQLWTCMDCDGVSTLVWRADKKTYAWLEAPQASTVSTCIASAESFPLEYRKAAERTAKLPQYVAWAAHARKAGVRPVLMPTVDKQIALKGKCYWAVTWYEDHHPTHLHRWNTFYVPAKGPILVMDLDGDPAPLSKLR
jgi:hypothetical protein